MNLKETTGHQNWIHGEPNTGPDVLLYRPEWLKSFEELEKMETLFVSHFYNLKMETKVSESGPLGYRGEVRVWVSRMGPEDGLGRSHPYHGDEVVVEEYRDGRWRTIGVFHD